MTNNLAQRAADELNVEGSHWDIVHRSQDTMQTVSRLIAEKDALQARIDELEAQTKRRSEPMPEPVPEWVVIAAFAEFKKAFPFLYPDWQAWWRGTAEAVRIGYTGLIWERGYVEPVDPAEALAREVIEAWQGDLAYPPKNGNAAFAKVVAVLKRGTELAKEIG